MKRPAVAVEASAVAAGAGAGGKHQKVLQQASSDMDIHGADVAPEASLFSVHQAIDHLAERYSTSPAVEDEQGVSWTYAQLKDASVQLALAISARVTTEHAVGSSAPATTDAWPAPVALLMRRSSAWVAATIAAMRLGRPSLSLSGDLGNAEERSRNRDAVLEHRPCILVIDPQLPASAEPSLLKAAAGVPVVDVGALLTLGQTLFGAFPPRMGNGSPDDVLYIVYTGGTTSASKSVAITHRMALHELEVYPQIAPLQCTDRVLHQSSAYWGATSLGIFDLAWASGGCLVMTDSGAGPAEVARAIQSRSITTIGVVPSVLEALEPEQCPSVRVIFTWGEALATSTATRWAPHAALLDLLIASEYWLILVADHRARLANAAEDRGGRTGFRPVPGARLTLRPPDPDGSREGLAGSHEEVADGEVGELFMAGPPVSSIGYTNPDKNNGAFVDLCVGDQGIPVRHFRTRDLARRRADGSLEYCGRADGFAKVGGKWLDLAAVEQKLLAAGCRDAALVWDEVMKRRHAAVVLHEGPTPQQSLVQRFGQLQRLLPRETHLHVLAGLPHNPATGKVNRGRLARQLADATEATPMMTPPHEFASSSAAARKVGRSLKMGLLLAGRAGARGGLLASMIWRLAPGLLPAGGAAGKGGALAGLPEGLAEGMGDWVRWHRACHYMTPAALRALPHIAVLLLDGGVTGLEPFVRLVAGPIGWLGAALLICHCAKPWLRCLLMASGIAHAQRERGGTGWVWSFWSGWPVLADQWVSECWRGSSPVSAATIQAVRAVRNILKVLASGKTLKELPELSRCNFCGDWSFDGCMWKGYFYCAPCTEGWNDYQKTLQQDGLVSSKSPSGTPEHTPRWSSTRWLPGLDVVDFTAAEVGQAKARMPVRATSALAGAAKAQATATTPIGRVVERITGIDAGDPSSSLASLESLKVIALVSALRRELGYDLAASDVARSSCLEELEELCLKAKAAGPSQSSDGVQGDAEGSKLGDSTGDAWAILAIPRFWKAPVGWLIRLDAVPEERAMRAACWALVRRHAGLRACPYKTSGDEAVATMCNQAAPMVLTMGALLGRVGERFISKASAGFFATWPRVVVAPRGTGPVPQTDKEVANFEWLRFTSEADLRSAAWLRARSRGFRLPASISVLVLSRDAGATATTNGNHHGVNGNLGPAPSKSKDEAYLHVAVNHAVSDAACIVPLVTDLLVLHAAAIRVQQTDSPPTNLRELADAAEAAAALPPAPNGLAVQQGRLHAALTAASGGTCGDTIDICHSVFHPRRRGCDHYVRMKQGACSLLEAGAGVIGIPSDHLLVAVIATAYAKISGKLEVKLTLIVPMRDGRGEGRAIANMATTRHLTMCFKGRSLLAVVLHLSQRLRRREWDVSDVFGDDGDRVFINIRDIPKFEGASPVMEDVDTRRATTRFVRNVMEMFVDRESQHSWCFSIGIRDDLSGNAFSQALRCALWRSAMDPLSPAVHAEPLAAPSAAAAAAMQAEPKQVETPSASPAALDMPEVAAANA